jgi:hypothetical protein
LVAQSLVRRPCEIRRIGATGIRYDYATQIAQGRKQRVLLSSCLNF